MRLPETVWCTLNSSNSSWRVLVITQISSMLFPALSPLTASRGSVY